MLSHQESHPNPNNSFSTHPLTPTSFKSTPSHKQFFDEVKSPQFTQKDYSSHLYEAELAVHQQSFEEYEDDIFKSMVQLTNSNRPDLDLYKQQPYLTFAIRSKLIDFLLKMSVRLKILPFVFFRAVRIFDRYCSKRIVLLDQAQLIITTCLWIASKVQGGNNHFVNLNNLEKITCIKTINDLGYGSGGKYLGPTERFRLPKLHELVKLCGAKCKYDQGMFKQMEIHILSSLDWSLNDPGIEEFITTSREFCIMSAYSADNEMFKVKEFLCYLSLYAPELIDINIIELSQVMLALINEALGFYPGDRLFQKVIGEEAIHTEIEPHRYRAIKTNLIKAVMGATDYSLRLFNSRGPQFFYNQINALYKQPTSNPYKNESTSFSCGQSSPAKRIKPDNSPVTPTSPMDGISMSMMAMLKKFNNHSHTNINNSPMLSPQPRSKLPMLPHQVSTPTRTTNVHIPPPHQLGNMNYTLSTSPMSQSSGKTGSLYRASTYSSPNTGGIPGLKIKLYKLPIAGRGLHHANGSQVSIGSSTSSKEAREDTGADLFEFDYIRKSGVGTPLSENDSPLFNIAKPSSAF
ncbi:hypothetical protein G9P44_004760 [Scheffersomyces stipitis]|nr:hypothetical protein G9P44_004760 [Scheffersomyces stipitis]